MNLSPEVIEAKEDLFFGGTRDQNHPPNNFGKFLCLKYFLSHSNEFLNAQKSKREQQMKITAMSVCCARSKGGNLFAVNASSLGCSPTAMALKDLWTNRKS